MARSHVRYNVEDRAGNKIQNATVTFYVTGTSTLVNDLYTAATGGSAVASAEFVSNVQGEVEAWMETPKTVDVQVADTGHTAYYSGATGELLTFAAFTETIEIQPPPENVATIDGSNTFTGTITFTNDINFAGPSGAPIFADDDNAFTGDNTHTGSESFTTNATSFYYYKSQIKPYDFTHAQYGGAIAGDWTVAFNAAATACNAAGGGELLIPEADTPYDVSLSSAGNAQCLKILSNILYLGHGPGSILRLKTNAAGNASGTRVLCTPAASGYSNIVLADFVIDGNKANQAASSEQDHGIFLQSAMNVTMERLIIKNCGASLQGSDGIQLSLCTKSKIMNNDISGCNRVLINTQYSSTSTVKDNTLHDTTGWAMKMEFDSPNTSYGMRFIDNKCEVVGSGISVTKGAGTLSDVQIVGNDFEMSSGTGNTINIEADNVVIERNNVRNATGAMIRSQRTGTKIDIINNTLTGGSATGTHGAIELGGGSEAPPTNVKIIGNTFNAVPQYGVHITQTSTTPFVPSAIRIAENKFFDTVGAAVRLGGTTGVEIHDNRFDNCGTGGDNCAVLMGTGNKGSARISIHDNRFKNMSKGVDITSAAGNVSTVDASSGVIGSAVSTNLVVAAGDGTKFYVGQYIRISTEMMKVTAMTVRTDTCGITNGSNVVTDASIGGGDNGKNVSGTGIPSGTTITAVTPGVSFTMSANATQTSASASLTIYTDTLTVTRGTEGTAAIATIGAGNAVQVLFAQGVTVVDNIFSAVTTPINGSANLTGRSVSGPNFPVDGSGTPATVGTSAYQNVTAGGTLAVTGAATVGSLSGTTITDATDFVLGTTTGTKIGTGTTQKLGFRGVTPVATPSAITQTYSTATRTHANLTSATLTDNSAGTGNTTVEALPDPADTPASADALRDDLVANLIPALRNNIADLTAQVNALRVDLVNAKGVVNSVVDDLQAQGLEG